MMWLNWYTVQQTLSPQFGFGVFDLAANEVTGGFSGADIGVEHDRMGMA
jgi:hypothetical protein